MGQWGLETCSGDSVWDLLEAKNIHKMTQKEVEKSLKLLWKDSKSYYDEDEHDFDKLGVVIWCLSQGKRVPVVKLEKCLQIANRFHSMEIIEEQGWGEEKERQKQVEKEIELIKFAIKNKGKGKKKYIPGLVDKIADFLGE